MNNNVWYEAVTFATSKRDGMKKLALAFFLFFVSFYGQGQNATSYIRPVSLGFSFGLYDFVTPQRIRATSLGSVIRHKQIAHFKEMGAGIGLSYFKGLRKKIDFAGTLAVASASYNLPDAPANSAPDFFMQADASLQFKLLSEKYFLTPYLAAGLGANEQGGTYGAFMPLGVGVKANFFNEAAFFINLRYNAAVTDETVRPHFVYNFGIAGVIGGRKQQ